MAIIVYIYPNSSRLQQTADGTEAALANDNSRLSLEEFDVLADKLADLSMKIDGPDAQPLSDYAMSRESIYEDYPKL